MNINPKERAERARDYFEKGYNCAQSVLLAYADLYNVDHTMAAALSSGFGGGMGRLREMCGACSGMFMVAGLAIPATDVTDHNAKTTNYKMVQDLATRFREANGSYICRELLNLQQKIDPPTPEQRTETYYKKRPCPDLVYFAAQLVGERLNEYYESIDN